MPETVDGNPIWGLAFDKDGDINPEQKSTLTDGVKSAGLTDLVLFSHGWNNDEQAAKSLYERWFHLLSAQLGAGRTVGYVGIRWPAQLWRDEPIPDFGPSSQPDHGGAAAATVSRTFSAGPVTIDAEQLADLKELFPNAEAELDSVAALLATPTAPDTPEKLFDALRKFSRAAGESLNDGEADGSAIPGMLDAGQDPRRLFETFAARLSDGGVRFETGDGAAGRIGDFGAKLLHGAKEALRQASYWQMKNRAGVVGTKGVGPVIAELGRQFPNLRIHLIGHSFGARVVSFALDGLPAQGPTPVKAVTLLQGAYSRFAFADPVPFGLVDRKGALAGKLDRVDGPFTVCFSSHDRALGTMYPLASMASGDNASAGMDPLAPWRAMGSHGAFNSPTEPLGSVGHQYQFQPGAILNLNASDVVIKDAGPSGAHSDIFHEELAWVAASAGQLN
jgi:hypothetical protein